MTISRGWIPMLAALALALVACGDNNKPFRPDARGDAPDSKPEQRGEYIMNVLGACSFCHTPLLPNGTRDLERAFAGISCFADLTNPVDFTDDGNGVGCLSTRNLTPHATGLGNATDTQIKNAFRNGIRTDGKKLVPVMPWFIFHNMTDDDADAVVAYLRSLPPVDNPIKANEPPFSNYNDGVAAPTGFEFVDTWAAITPILDNEIPYPAGGANNQSAMRGRYLASSVGLCIDCHTPEFFPFGLKLDTSRTFAGGKVFPKEQLGLLDPSYPPVIASRNLTSDTTGLGGWTKNQIKLAIAEGRDLDNKAVCAATHGGAISPYAGLTPQDLDDIAEYIANLPAVVNDTANDPLAANCGPPPFPDPSGAETGTDCGNFADDDGDTFADDGCPYPCGNCQGPTVP